MMTGYLSLIGHHCFNLVFIMYSHLFMSQSTNQNIVILYVINSFYSHLLFIFVIVTNLAILLVNFILVC
jgi:hypothetical protein